MPYLRATERQAITAGLGLASEVSAAQPITQLSGLTLGALVTDEPTHYTGGFFVPHVSGDEGRTETVEIWAGLQGGALTRRNNAHRVFAETGEVGDIDDGFAAVIPFLTPNTAYDYELRHSGQTLVSGSFSTRALPSFGAATRTVNVSNQTQLQNALNDLEYGDDVVIALGTINLTATMNIPNIAGTAANGPARIRGVSREGTTLNAGNVADRHIFEISGVADSIIFEDMTWEDTGTSAAGLRATADTDDICVRRITGTGLYHFIRANDRGDEHTRWTVHQNRVQGDVPWSTIAFPIDAYWANYGIALIGQGHDIGWNTLAGYGDSFTTEALGGGEPTFRTLSNYYHHNVIPWGADDGFELDESRRNVLVYRCRVFNNANVLSSQATFGGPIYVVETIGWNLLNTPYKLKADVNDYIYGIVLYNNLTQATADNKGNPLASPDFHNNGGEAWANVAEGAHRGCDWRNLIMLGNTRAPGLRTPTYFSDVSGDLPNADNIFDRLGFWPDGDTRFGTTYDDMAAYAAAESHVANRTEGSGINGSNQFTDFVDALLLEEWTDAAEPALDQSTNLPDLAHSGTSVFDNPGSGETIQGWITHDYLGPVDPMFEAGDRFSPIEALNETNVPVGVWTNVTSSLGANLDLDGGFSAFSGGWYDSDRHRWYGFGGGHNDYGGDEAPYLDLNTFRWVLPYISIADIDGRTQPHGSNQAAMDTLYEAQYSAGGSVDGLVRVPGFSHDRPMSRHSYDGMAHVPGWGGFMTGGYVWEANYDNSPEDAWRYNPDNELGNGEGWEYLGVPDWGNPDAGLQSVFYNDEYDHLYVMSNGTLYRRNYNTGVDTVVSATGSPNAVTETTMTYDRTRNVAYRLGHWQSNATSRLFQEFDFSSQTAGTWNALAGCPSDMLGPGLEYVERYDRVFALGDQNSRVYVYNPNTDTWDSTQATGAPGNSRTSLFNRFFFDPVNQVFLFINIYPTQTYPGTWEVWAWRYAAFE